jgi:DNA-directed RNA polymerase subunit RPC12/RpoP
MKYLEMDDDSSSDSSSDDESADEDGKYSCVFCTKKFDRKDFKEYHEYACLTGSKEIVFKKPTSISILDMLRILEKDCP